jgi:NADPH:quinone reductase-like Zn-dependent oxidoreductase
MDMLAITQDGYGGPEVLVPGKTARPAPVPTEVLVRVHATSVNPVDWKTRAGSGMGDLFGAGPMVLGWDVSGVVEETGPGVTRFAPGDEVFGMPRFPYPAGSYAEYVAAPSRHFARKPAGLDHEHAAALPLAGLTAWQALVDTADVQAGQRVLVHAAAGGVGHLAVQLAKARGAYVIGTASAAKHDFVLGLGADEMIDYRTADFATAVSGVDVVLDAIGGENVTRSVATVVRGGQIVSIRGGGDERSRAAADAAGVRIATVMVEPDHSGLEGLAALVAAGRLRVEVDRVLPLEDAAAAHRLGEAGQVRGKIVLSVTG